MSTCTWTKRSPRPRPRSLGTPSPFSGMTVAGLGSGGDGQVPGVVQRVEGDAAAQGGQGHRHVRPRRGGRPPIARRRGRAAPTDGRRGRRWGRPGIRPGRDRPGAGSNPRRPRRGCPRSGSAARSAAPRRRSRRTGCSMNWPVPWQRWQGTAVMTWPRIDWRTRRSSPAPWHSGQRTADGAGPGPRALAGVAVHRGLDLDLAGPRTRPPGRSRRRTISASGPGIGPVRRRPPPRARPCR